MPCYLFLPDYYGIEFSENFPILTISRIITLLFYIYAFKNRKKNINIKSIKIKSLPKEYYLLFIYFFLRIISNLRYISLHGQAAKTIFSIILEQTFLVIAFYMLSPSSEELMKMLKTIVTVATVLFVLGFLESVTYIRLFDELNTVSRDMINEHYYRLGLLRATTTMKMPGHYANMCTIILPTIIYLYETLKQKRYLISEGLCILAIIHSCSRANIFFLFILFTYALLFIFKRESRFTFLKNTLFIIVTLTLIIIVLSLSSVKLRYFYEGTAKSLLNEIGFEFDLNNNVPQGAQGFGGNTYGSASRLEQFTGIYYTFNNHPLFGFGSGAEDRSEIKYYRFRNSSWYKHKAYDVGIVEIICDEGLLGLLAFVSLFMSLLLRISKIKATAPKSHLYFMLFSYLICTLSTANMIHFLFLIVILVIQEQNINNFIHNY